MGAESGDHSSCHCTDPHRAEVFHTIEPEVAHPAIHPGDDAMRNYALRICYEHSRSLSVELRTVGL